MSSLSRMRIALALLGSMVRWWGFCDWAGWIRWFIFANLKNGFVSGEVRRSEKDRLRRRN